MASTIFVTGATGQTGGNVCEQLVGRGDHVRALVRKPEEATALAAIGVELVQGDISDAEDVVRAAKGQPEDTISTAAGINRACEIAGIDHRVEDLDYRSDPESLTAEFGPTLMAIAEAAAKDGRKLRSHDNLTARRLDYRPMSFDDGLRLLIPWLRDIGRLN